MPIIINPFEQTSRNTLMQDPGGSGGSIQSYPNHLKAIHAAILNDKNPLDYDNTSGDQTKWDSRYLGETSLNVVDAMERQSEMKGAGSPYARVEAHDPDNDISRMETRLDELLFKMDEYDPTTIMTTAITEALEDIDSFTDGSTEVDETVKAHEKLRRMGLAQETSRHAAQLFDAGAVMSSQFITTMVNIEMRHLVAMEEFDAKLRLLNWQSRSETTRTFGRVLTSLFSEQLVMRQLAAQGSMDWMKLNQALHQDQIGKDLEYATRDAQWDLDLLQQGFNMMGSIYGAAVTPRGQTFGERTAQTLAASVSTGVSAGTAARDEGIGVLAGLLNLGIGVVGNMF